MGAMENIVSEKVASVLDLLEQIEAVNEMINLHLDDSFMREQYEYRKQGFVKILASHLSSFEISLDDLAAA